MKPHKYGKMPGLGRPAYFLVRSFSHLSGSGPNLSHGLLGPGSLGDFGGRGAPVSGVLNLDLLAIERFSFGSNYAVRAGKDSEKTRDRHICEGWDRPVLGR